MTTLLNKLPESERVAAKTRVPICHTVPHFHGLQKVPSTSFWSCYAIGISSEQEENPHNPTDADCKQLLLHSLWSEVNLQRICLVRRKITNGLIPGAQSQEDRRSRKIPSSRPKYVDRSKAPNTRRKRDCGASHSRQCRLYHMISSHGGLPGR